MGKNAILVKKGDKIIFKSMADNKEKVGKLLTNLTVFGAPVSVEGEDKPEYVTMDNFIRKNEKD